MFCSRLEEPILSTWVTKRKVRRRTPSKSPSWVLNLITKRTKGQRQLISTDLIGLHPIRNLNQLRSLGIDLNWIGDHTMLAGSMELKAIQMWLLRACTSKSCMIRWVKLNKFQNSHHRRRIIRVTSHLQRLTTPLANQQGSKSLVKSIAMRLTTNCLLLRMEADHLRTEASKDLNQKSCMKWCLKNKRKACTISMRGLLWTALEREASKLILNRKELTPLRDREPITLVLEEIAATNQPTLSSTKEASTLRLLPSKCLWTKLKKELLCKLHH